MARHPWLDPSPFFFDGGRVGALLIHGFTGAPTEMRPLGELLASRGYTVSGPLLPGHGTEPADLAGVRWTDWTGAIEEAYLDLRGRCDQLFVAGLSLGSLLTLNLAASQPVDGIAVLSPAIFVANPMMRFSWIAQLLPLTMRQDSPGSDLVDPDAVNRIWCYEQFPARAAHQVHLLNRRVRALLPQITVPVLAIMSTGDEALKYQSGPYLIEQIGSADKELLPLHESGHNILADGERHLVMEKVAEFFAQCVAR